MSARTLRRCAARQAQDVYGPPLTWTWLHANRHWTWISLRRQYSTEPPNAPQTPQTLYDILGVNKNASSAQIKSRFYEMAKMYHPDFNPSGRDTYERANIAYRTLTDNGERKAYDKRLKKTSAKAVQARSTKTKQKPTSTSQSQPLSETKTARASPPPPHPKGAPSTKPPPPPRATRASIYATFTSGPRQAPRPAPRPPQSPLASSPKETPAPQPPRSESLRDFAKAYAVRQLEFGFYYPTGVEEPIQMQLSDPRWLERRFNATRATMLNAFVLDCQPRFEEDFPSYEDWLHCREETVSGITQAFGWPIEPKSTRTRSWIV
ncbi:hypothetical protein PLICRDRAFT_702309 [Plicaturopsis crispa FD-325 SS-3]|uniref:J domain-containing protein n=1 Tax=Plicaturopsis crispa FD-325 SS-3 TaxID=944288 RepID=A0A0C9T3A6_PLICR|nr:hypothetical protein PLICRDRAFT_702309 [Plicaturopsis crispa FD-325 SS-3]